MTEHVLDLPGLDGQNPLGFLAALGLLRVLNEHAHRTDRRPPRLAFSEVPPFTARVATENTMEQVKEIVLADAVAQGTSVALGLAFDGQGELCPKDAPGATRDLKISPTAARRFLLEAASAGRRDADLAAALLSDVVQDNNGASKPTAFHFTAGQQAFLKMVEELRLGLDGDQLEEALVGPWRNTSTLPSLAWDSSVARLYALRASDPSGEKRGSVPAANWLAVQGLAFFPVMPERGRLRTTNVGLGWKDVSFTWPLWAPWVETSVARALLRLDPTRRDQRERASLGVSVVFRARIQRSEQGGYGSFSPAEVVPPMRRAGEARTA